jgi:hypothetical protein
MKVPHLPLLLAAILAVVTLSKPINHAAHKRLG